MKLSSILLAASLLIIPLRAESITGKRPNIIFILTDDQGFGDVSANGNPILQTPNVNRLHVLCSAGSISAADSPVKKRLLILGDSISIGYTPFVRKMLANELSVHRPRTDDGKAENCSGTKSGVANIDRWLLIDGGKWDVIHFNWGLHDLKHEVHGKTSERATDPPQSSVEAYEKQIREIVGKLKSTGAKLIFATTTPVPDGKLYPYRADADVVRYNEVALRVMKENGIAVDDLYAFVKPRVAELQLPANVHFLPDGYKIIANQVIKSIKEALK